MTERREDTTMEKIVSLCKRRGFVYQGSEIYGGLAGIYDYGPLGVELRHNIKQHFWNKFVAERDDVYGMSAAILMPERVWEASGHTELFTDPLVECERCHEHIRADKKFEHIENKHTPTSIPRVTAFKLVKKGFTTPKNFNLLVKTRLGVSEQSAAKAYLRGEITQGVHVNFKNVLDSMHPKVPFGIGQIGKAFRNEISPGDFLFRQREFEQLELQYYVRPGESEGEKQFEYWKQFAFEWYQSLGIKKEHLRLRQHAEDERAHYARDAWDIEYKSPMGWKEAMGIHHRGDWDLRRHQEYSDTSMEYTDEGEKFIPWVIECSGGVDRAFLFVLLDAYREDELGGEKRIYLAFPSHLAPIRAAVFPLLKNKPELVEKAKEVRAMLRKTIPNIAWDDNGNIGKRYRRQDEIGTPYCITIDFDTLDGDQKDTVTVRDRDSGEQKRVAISDLTACIDQVH